MSAETWLAKYYSIPAEKMKRKTWKECQDHSILKWSGLHYLKKHGLHLDGWVLLDKDDSRILAVDSDSCALCQRSGSKYEEVRCRLCPIKKVTGKSCQEAWEPFADNSDYKPMLRLLRKVRKAMK